MGSTSSAESIWQLLHKYNNSPGIQSRSIQSLFAGNPGRFREFSISRDGLLLDFSKTHIDARIREALLDLAQMSGLPNAINALFAGEKVNWTENRAALHWAARARRPVSALNAEDNAQLERQERRLADFSASLRQGRLGSIDGITDIIHLGIGGSSLGPKMVIEALGSNPVGNVPNIHFLASADGHAVQRLLSRLQADQTALLVVSKSFATRETRLNTGRILAWMTEAGIEAPIQRVLAITANPARAWDFGIPDKRILTFGSEIGGRYSLWSSAGLPIAIALGLEQFQILRAGARAMDEHFATADLPQNQPVMLALAGIWQRNIRAAVSAAVFGYDSRLRDFSDWLQQLDMESNGKSIGQNGRPVTQATSAALFGGCGTEAQHAVFQMLHQGTDGVAVDFIGVLQADHDYPEHHRFQLANLLAQSNALAFGRDADATRRFLSQSGLSMQDIEAQIPHRIFHGNRPSVTVLLDRLDAYHLGQLLALYEHKIFAQGVIWNINPFDQWGVEFGKTLAGELETVLLGDAETGAEDDLTRYVADRIKT